MSDEENNNKQNSSTAPDCGCGREEAHDEGHCCHGEHGGGHECGCHGKGAEKSGTCRCGRGSKKCGLCPCVRILVLVAILISVGALLYRNNNCGCPLNHAPQECPTPCQTALHSEKHGDFHGDEQVRPVSGNPNDPLVLRQKGEFTKALEILEKRQKESPSEEQAMEILCVIEDTGDAQKMIAKAQEFQKEYPESMGIEWELTKGQLFAAATFRPDPSRAKDVENWLNEAEQGIKKLEGSSWKPEEVPGYLAVLKAELAFMREDWANAETYAKEGLRLGTTAGETGDLYAMLFDVACRQGDKKAAEGYIDEALHVVAKASANSYYGLRMFREEALIVKAFVLDRTFSHNDLDRLWKIHTDLQAAGYVDPTSPDDSEAITLHKSLNQYLDMYARKNYAGCLTIIQNFLDNKPNHTPRCFFSEAVMSPLRPLYLNMAAGKLCLAMGDKEKAKTYFEAAAAAHPNDKLVEAEMAKAEEIQPQANEPQANEAQANEPQAN